MRINSSRNSLARARMIRSANRQRRTKVLSSQTNKTDKGNISSDTTRTDTSTSSQITLYENMEKAAKALQTNVKNLQNIVTAFGGNPPLPFTNGGVCATIITNLTRSARGFHRPGAG